ncbi:MAG: osmotically-inducible lipoprotein B [Betaproteobacteria bacterium HGW-Betaproteobacteria-20]|jgi:osmotically inducible lipoprotein OsmB|nr:MAG: osmotically-inducible lipoprotein B [Betaproteobacteria bacterium HGW-Betaproteobacteria-20]
MKTTHSFSLITVIAVLLISLSGCSGMSTRDKNTAIGAGVGAAAGAVLTGGGAVGTIGGAAVGGIIGNQIGKDDK